MFLHSLNPSFSFPKFNLQNLGRPNFQDHNRTQIQQANRDTSVSAQQITGRHVINSLEKVLNTEGLSLKGLNAEDFTPEKVADNILSSVKQAFGRFQQSQPEADHSEFFAQVKEGLQRGFSEAKDILQNFGALQGKIADDVDKTYDLTLQGLDRLASNGLSVNESTLAFQSLASQTSRSAEIQIETQQGDKITISFNQSSSSSRSVLQTDQAGFSLNAYQQSYEQNNEFSITVEGDLNKDEQRSLNKLMRQMHEVSNAFFHGNGRSAFNQARKMGFDTEQIAGFTLDLNMQKSVQAVAAYQQTRAPEQTINTDVLSQAGDFLNRTKDLLTDVETALQTLADPKQSFNDLFTEIGTLINNEPDVQDVDHLLAEIIDHISSNIFDKTNIQTEI